MSSFRSRRDVLRAGGLLAAGAVLAGRGEAAPPSRTPSLVLAHLTDIHVRDRDGAAEGMSRAVAHACAHPARPAFLVNGGDAIHDALAVSADETRAQWRLWSDVLVAQACLPVHHCIGNHDIFGWNQVRSGADGSEPHYGKAWALEAFGLERPYYSFDAGGWHFVVLDSCQPTGARDGIVYRPVLDNEQFEWLAGDLAAVAPERPVCVISHVPIVSGCAYFYGPASPDFARPWWLLQLLVHLDARRLKDLFARHPNVRVCLSGHIHLVDEVRYGGVTYYCNGAVSGDLWRGAHQECRPGYAIVKLYPDGTSEREYVEWEAV